MFGWGVCILYTDSRYVFDFSFVKASSSSSYVFKWIKFAHLVAHYYRWKIAVPETDW